MEKLVFFDSEEHQTLLPLTYTKPVSELRIGILKIREKWENKLNLKSTHLTQRPLTHAFPLNLDESNIFIRGGLLPTDDLTLKIKELNHGEALTKNGTLLAAKGADERVLKEAKTQIEFQGTFKLISRPWHIFSENGTEIEKDIATLNVRPNNNSEATIYGEKDKIFIHPSAAVRAISLNTEKGSIYIGENAKVSEGSVIRGPFALCNNAEVKMSSKIYSNTTVGPFSKVGGELNNVVIQGYSNKGHDGFLGNSVIGEWCNLGADTNCSNLKNNYSTVRIWDYLTEQAIDSELTFCGLIMGDHSKTGINTMLNTGTVVGVGANVFGGQFPPKFIPSFSWGSGSDFTEHNFQKFCVTAERMMVRRSIEFTDLEKDKFQAIFEQTEKYRSKS